MRLEPDPQTLASPPPDTRPMAGAGIGASLAGGLLRLDLSYPLTDTAPVVRFDIVFGRLRW